MKWIGETTPAWTIGGTKKNSREIGSKSAQNLSATTSSFPSPLDGIEKGTKIIFTNTTYKWKFPKAKRTNLYNVTYSPGPCTYFEQPKIDKEGEFIKTFEKKTFPRAKRQDFTQELKYAPSPAAYKPNRMGAPPQYSFGYKFDSIYTCDNPIGPGEYSPYEIIDLKKKNPHKPDQTKSNKFFSEQNSDDNTLNRTSTAPGPGHYKIQDVLENVHSTKLMSGPKKFFVDQAIGASPGPSYYNVDTHTLEFQLQKVKGFSFGGKYKDQTSAANSTPAPGEYHEEKSRKNNAGVSFSHSLRYPSRTSGTAIPGPGTYSQSLKALNDKKGTKFGTGNRPPLLLPNNGPAPGDYSVGGENKNPKWSFSGRRAAAIRKIEGRTPGPGHYDIEPMQSNFISGRGFGTSNRTSFDREQAKIPGPGAYEQKPEFDKKGTKFGHAKKYGLGGMYDVDNELGPGHYDLRSTVPQPPPYEKEVVNKLKF